MPARVECPRRSAEVPVQPLRVVFVTNIPSPYQIDFFSELAAQPEIQLKVIFAASTEVDRSFSVPGEFTFDGTILTSSRSFFTPKDWHCAANLREVLDGSGPYDLAVLSGSYFMPAFHQARRYMARHSVPWCYWGENPRKKHASGIRQRLKERYLQHVLGPARSILGVGSLACRSYQAILPDHRVENLPYAPNLDPLLSPPAEVRAAAERSRSEWGIPEPIVVLFSGSLTYRKAPDILLEAFARAADENPRLRLLLAGDGPMDGGLRSRAAELGLTDRIRFAGFLEGTKLHAAYLASDLFALPTRYHEGWGVVVQEAMAAGLPVIVSDRVGAAADLVGNGKNGCIITAEDVAALAAALSLMSERSGLCESQSVEAVAKTTALSVARSCVQLLLAAGLEPNLANAQPPRSGGSV